MRKGIVSSHLAKGARHGSCPTNVLGVARTIIGGAALAILARCGSGEGAASEALAIRQVSPSSIGARTGDFILTIVGTGFAADSRVVFGDVELGTLGHSSTVLRAGVPGGTPGTTEPGALSVSVRNSGGARSNQLPLVVTEAPPPVLSRVDSDLCAGATGPLEVTISGVNFTVDTTLESSGQPVPIAHRSRSTLSFSVPRELGHYSFTVTVPPPGGGKATIGYATFLGCD